MSARLVSGPRSAATNGTNGTNGKHWQKQEPDAPPHSNEAEQATLGGILKDNAVLGPVRAILDRPELFYADANRLVYAAVLALAARGVAVDLVTMGDELHRRGQVEEIGGYGYLAHLIDVCPAAASAVHHAHIVRDLAIRRGLIQTANGILRSALRPTGPGQELLEQAGQLVSGVTANYLSSQERWPEPIPLSDMPPVPHFPTEVFPASVQSLCNEIAEALPCPADFPGLAILAMAGGAIGNSRHIAITRTHTQAPCIFGAWIGKPGSKKTAPFKILQQPFVQVQNQRLTEWKRVLKLWKTRDDDDKGDKPVARRCLTEDFTMESLMPILEENPRGVMVARNEITAAITSMDQYKSGKGSDRQMLLNLWDGVSYLCDRKSDRQHDGGPVFVRHPFIGLVGCLPPAKINLFRQSMREGDSSDDGMLDRFLFVYPESLKATGERWLEVSPEGMGAWQLLIEKLLGLEMDTDNGGDRYPRKVWLTREAKQEWQAFTDNHASEMNHADFPEFLLGPWSKLTGYCARLALIVHYLHFAAGEVGEEEVDGESMARAAQLITYFKAHLRKVYAAMEADPRVRSATRVLNSLRLAQGPTISKRDIWNPFRGTWKHVDDMDPILRLIERHGYIRQVTQEEGKTRGRPSIKYEIHPSIYSP